MPESPEVQTVVDGLQFLKGRTVNAVYRTNLRPWIVNENVPSIIDDKILDVTRIGKFIIVSHESNLKTVIHLSFTGMFSHDINDYLALKIFLDNEKVLYFSDKRGLSKIRTLSLEEFLSDTTLKAHKVDGLSSTKEEILARLQNLKGRGIKKELKPFLLDYHNICGIGNIYGSEICFEMKLNPKTKFYTLTDKQLVKLATIIQLVLRRAYASGGSSIESFTDLNGKRGDAQKYHKVYAKKICSDCGARIISFKQDGRTTYYCPVCQGGDTPDDHIR